MTERKLASIRKIDSIVPIEGADAIEVAVVGGWKVVVKKGEYQPGDLAVYCEIDSWIPHELAPFLSKGQEPREYNQVKGERLRTIKLRGQLSQGLLLPMSVIASAHGVNYYPPDAYQEDTDVTDELGIQKWDAPIPAQLSGQVRGNFPSFIPKTDQERIQNLGKELKVWQEKNYTWEVTEKLDGSSMTVYVNGSDEGVCSRNLSLKRDEQNSFWKEAIQKQLIEKIRRADLNLALQGELIGEGIQKNPYGIKGQEFRVFDIYDIDAGRYYTPDLRVKFCKDFMIAHVPVLPTVILNGPTIDIDMILGWAEAKSFLNAKTEREGLVFKCFEAEHSFKAISNKFLLKHE